MNKARILAAGAALSLSLLVACSAGTDTKKPASNETKPQQAATQQQESALSFVAADKTNWDKAVNIGDFSFTLAVELNPDGTATLTGTCVDRKQAETQQGGPGGGFGNNEEEAAPTAEPAPLTDAEKAAQNFQKAGTWEKEAGYGYTITIDGYTTKTNFDKASSRHIFYMPVNGSDLVEFQGKDTAFRKELAADYKDFEEREAKYRFIGSGSTATGNASSTKVYLEQDGTANAITQQGSSPSYARGTWSENADKTLTVMLSGMNTVDYCDIAGKEGYRLTFNSTTMYCSVSGADVAYTDKDFDGETVKTLQCGQQDYTIELTEKGFANIMKGAEKSAVGRYTGDGDSLKITLDGVEYGVENGQIKLVFKSGEGSSASEEERAFNADGTVPEGDFSAPANDAASAGGEGDEGENASAGGEGAPEGDNGSAGGEGAPEGDNGSAGGDAPTQP